MKFALIIPDGVADEGQPSLDGKSPLAAAHLPHADEIARLGIVGRTNNVPESMESGSDVGTLSLFGYDPLVYHTGRAPLEAAAQGIELGEHDWAVRCNLVTIADEIMRSFTAEQIPSGEGARLLAHLQADLPAGSPWNFVPGVSYRNLLLYRAGEGPAPLTPKIETTPPHDIQDRNISEFLPKGPGSGDLRLLMSRSRELLAEMDSKATQVWLWGEGRRPALESFQSRFGPTGALVTAVDLLRGIGSLLGWDIINVPTATGYTDTDYAAKGQAAIGALQEGADFVVVHVEATDEASHEGDTAAKLKAVEEIDQHIVGPVHDYLRSQGDYRILMCPDHPTFLRTKTHSHGYCPFTLCGSGVEADGAQHYDDEHGMQSDRVFEEGHELMPFFFAV